MIDWRFRCHCGRPASGESDYYGPLCLVAMGHRNARDFDEGLAIRILIERARGVSRTPAEKKLENRFINNFIEDML